MKRLVLIGVIGLVLSGLNPAVHAELKLDVPDLNLPDLGDPANSAVSTTEETALGLKLVREQRGSSPMIEDPELIGWLRALGNRLVSSSGTGGNFYFLISKDRAINAFAMPGGVVVINAGLILSTNSESELAAVMAHEIAHVNQRHIARMAMNDKGSPWVAGLGVLAGAAAASKSPDAAQALITGTLATQAHKQLVFSQQMETEADRVGLRILSAARFDPQAMPLFMEKLDRRTMDQYGDLTQYLRTHPLSIDRLSDTRTRANQLGKRPVQEEADYAYMREKLRTLIQPGASPVTDGDPALSRYAQAARQLANGQDAAVIKTLGASAGHLPSALLLAQAYNHVGQYEQTEKLLTPLANSRPNQEAIVAPLAEALLNLEQAARAWQWVSRVSLTEQSTLDFLDLRQRVAEQAGQVAEAYRSAAERNLRMGEYKQARAILEQATRLPGTPAHTAARFQAMAQEIARLETRNKQLPLK